jgi:hypothetical protein
MRCQYKVGRMKQKKDQHITYPSHNDNSCTAALNNNILHRPGPVPVNLQSCIAVYKYQVASSELLIAQVCTGIDVSISAIN